jgi:hypothetical protein
MFAILPARFAIVPAVPAHFSPHTAHFAILFSNFSLLPAAEPPWRWQLDNAYFNIDKLSCDNSLAFFAFCTDTFGDSIPVKQSFNHIGGMIHRAFAFEIFRNYESKSFKIIPIFPKML